MEFHDVAEITISSDDVNNLPAGECIKSDERPILGSKNLCWAFHVRKNSSLDFRVDLSVSSTDYLLTARGWFAVAGADPCNIIFHFRLGNKSSCVPTTNLGTCIRRLGPNGSIKVDVTFGEFARDPEIRVLRFPPQFTIDDFVKRSDHYLPDARIVVGTHTLDVHRHVLCMISPVFNAAFTHDTKEAQTGTIDIKDFDFDTVKNVIDSCYGRECNAKSVADRLNMLRFADKYDIRVVSESVETYLSNGLTLTTFCEVTTCAFDMEKADLKVKCAKFYKANVAQVTFLPAFGNMNPDTIVDLIQLATSVCCYTH